MKRSAKKNIGFLFFLSTDPGTKSELKHCKNIEKNTFKGHSFV